MSDGNRSDMRNEERRVQDVGRAEGDRRGSGSGDRAEGWNERTRRENPGWSESGREGSPGEENAREGRELADDSLEEDRPSERTSRREFGATRGEETDEEQRRRMENPDAAPSIRLSKGAHLVLKRTAPWKAALATPIDKYRITFALPWEDMLLLGTTDEVYEGDPADVAVT